MRQIDVRITGAMRRLHLIVGALLFIAFIVTGRLMRHDFPDKEIIDQEFRMLMRSRHIYIFFSAMINLALGLYFTAERRPLSRAFQYLGSAFLVGSGALLVWAWAAETYFVHHYSDLSRQGIYTALVGVIIHVIASISGRTPPVDARRSEADIQ
jgi:hypothetical protein